MRLRLFFLTGSILVIGLLLPPRARAGVTEQTFTVPLGQFFVLDQHGGPAVRMRVWNVDASFVDMNYTDEFSRGWSIHAAKHNSVQGREANLTLLYRHAATGYEVYSSICWPLLTVKPPSSSASTSKT